VEGTAGLADARVKLEQYFQDNRKYPTACVTSAAPGATEVKLQELQNFDLTCALTDTTYTVKATGKAAMAGFEYSIDQNNAKSSTFSGTGASKGWTAASPNNCWVIRKGALC